MAKQEEGHKCKICRKSFVSGQSLGGHMGIHSSRISACKKAAEAKFTSQIELGNSHFEDGDHKNCYQLRDNPKKSWRISDNHEHRITREANSCTECGIYFVTNQGLLGHMRCHSIKNEEGVASVSAIFSHTKIHSKKKSRVSDDSSDSLSRMENFSPVRRRRSRVMYQTETSVCSSSLTEFETKEMDMAADSLMMLSKGEIELSDNNSEYFRTENNASYDPSSIGNKMDDPGNFDDELVSLDASDCDGLLSTDKLLNEFLADMANLTDFIEVNKAGLEFLKLKSCNSSSNVLKVYERKCKKKDHVDRCFGLSRSISKDCDGLQSTDKLLNVSLADKANLTDFIEVNKAGLEFSKSKSCNSSNVLKVYERKLKKKDHVDGSFGLSKSISRDCDGFQSTDKLLNESLADKANLTDFIEVNKAGLEFSKSKSCNISSNVLKVYERKLKKDYVSLIKSISRDCDGLQSTDKLLNESLADKTNLTDFIEVNKAGLESLKSKGCNISSNVLKVYERRCTKNDCVD